MQKAIIIFSAIIVLFIAGLLTGLYVGNRDAESRISTIRTEYDGYIKAQGREIAGLKGSLGAAQGRIESARSGIAAALGIASRESDRTKRIGILVIAISDAIDQLDSDKL